MATSKVSPERPQPQYTLDVVQRIAAVPVGGSYDDEPVLRVVFSMIGDYFAEHAREKSSEFEPESNEFEFHITDSHGGVINVSVSDRP